MTLVKDEVFRHLTELARSAADEQVRAQAARTLGQLGAGRHRLRMHSHVHS